MAEPARNWSQDDLPELLITALDAAIDKGARAPVVLRLTELAGYTDWVLLVSGRSERNVRGITDGITDDLAKAGVKPLTTDGVGESLWTLLDYDDFLVHVFYHPVRTFYDLESMWIDAPRVSLDLPAEVLDDRELRQLDAPEPMPSFRGNRMFGGFDDEFDDDDGEPGASDVAAQAEPTDEPTPESDSDLFEA